MLESIKKLKLFLEATRPAICFPLLDKRCRPRDYIIEFHSSELERKLNFCELRKDKINVKQR